MPIIMPTPMSTIVARSKAVGEETVVESSQGTDVTASAGKRLGVPKLHVWLHVGERSRMVEGQGGVSQGEPKLSASGRGGNGAEACPLKQTRRGREAKLSRQIRERARFGLT